ncbi:hypothetical protein ACOMHN_011068 [Nucella lapillus]
MPRSFLVKKWAKAEEPGYHSYRIRDEDYEEDVIDISLKAVTPYTPYTPYTPPALPAAVAPLTVRVNNGEGPECASTWRTTNGRATTGRNDNSESRRFGYIHDIIPSPHLHNSAGSREAERAGEHEGREATLPQLHSESAATSPALPHYPYPQDQPLNMAAGEGGGVGKMEKENGEDAGEMVGEDDPSGHIFTNGVTVGYTFDAFFISDGRSKRRHSLDSGGSGDSNASDERPGVVKVCRQRYTCSECGKDYATSSNLSRHRQTHRSLDSKNAKKCPHCDKLYVSMPALSMHILTHDLRHTCNICGKNFSRPWLLQGHMRSHTGEKPYGCAHCGKAFADRSNLRAHMQTHSAFKQFTCNRCNKSFALKSYLNKHYESACIKESP